MRDKAIFIGFLGLALLAARWLTRFIAIRRFMRETGAERAKLLGEKTGFLGYKAMKQAKEAMQSGQYTAILRRRFAEHGPTWRVSGETFTADPENVRAIYHGIENWDVGTRKQTWAPLMSKGIFVSDGKEWEHSRASTSPGSLFHIASNYPHIAHTNYVATRMNLSLLTRVIIL